MREIALHLLDVARNSVEAGATRLLVTVLEDEAADRLVLEIVDNGRGMDEAALGRATDPFYSTRTTRRVGLGLPLLRATCERCGGGLQVQSEPGRGTHLTATLQLRHWDRPPLGDLGAVVQALACEAERVHLVYRHRVGSQWFTIDTNELQYELDDVHLRDPIVLAWLARHVNEQLARLREEAGAETPSA